MANRQPKTVVEQLRRTLLSPNGAGLTDGQLLACYLERRDDTAFEALVRRHGPMVLEVCRRILRGHHDAEDAFQATFLVLARKAALIVPREKVANWLYGVARTTAVRVRVANAKLHAREKQVAAMPEPEQTRPNLWVDLQPLLDQELGRLPDKYRVPIVLCDLEGKTQREAAQQLGWPEGTVAGWLSRGRSLLASRMARHGCTLSGAALAAVLSERAAAVTLPTALVVSTVQTAHWFATGQATAGVVSAQVAVLTEGVLKSMLLTKLWTALGVLVVAGLLLGATSFSYLANAQDQPKQNQKHIAEPELTQKVAPQVGKKEKGQPPKKNPPKFRDARIVEVLRQLQNLHIAVIQLQTEIEELEKNLPPSKTVKPLVPEKPVVKVFQVAELVGEDLPTGRPGPFPGRLTTNNNGEALIQIITKTVEPKSWDGNGGPGSIQYFAEGKSLIVRQSVEVMFEVANLLMELHKTLPPRESKGVLPKNKQKEP